MAMALDSSKRRSAFFGHDDPAIAGKCLTFRLAAQIVASHEIGNEFRPKRNAGRILFLAFPEHYPRERSARMFVNDLAIGSLCLLVANESHPKQRFFVAWGQDKMIDPL